LVAKPTLVAQNGTIHVQTRGSLRIDGHHF
jgi:hypothetical protein